MVGSRGARPVQPVGYDLRLPETAQADALRLLDASRAVMNQALTTLWPCLDACAAARSGPAWKQVDALLSSPDPHGSRQWRCEAEVVRRLLRAQAERRPAGKERAVIAAAIRALQRDLKRDPNGDLKRDLKRLASVSGAGRISQACLLHGGGRRAAVAATGLSCPPADSGEDLLRSGLVQDRLPAILTPAAHLPAVVRLRRQESSRFLQRLKDDSREVAIVASLLCKTPTLEVRWPITSPITLLFAAHGCTT